MWYDEQPKDDDADTPEDDLTEDEFEDLLEDADLEPEDVEDLREESEDDDWTELIESIEDAQLEDVHIVGSPPDNSEMAHHFNDVTGAINYASEAPEGVLWVVLDGNGGAYVYRIASE